MHYFFIKPLQPPMVVLQLCEHSFLLLHLRQFLLFQPKNDIAVINFMWSFKSRTSRGALSFRHTFRGAYLYQGLIKSFSVAPTNLHEIKTVLRFLNFPNVYLRLLSMVAKKSRKDMDHGPRK